jgi:hypothetical protein
VAAEVVVEQGMDVARMVDRSAQDARRHVLHRHRPRGVDGLGRVVGGFARDAFGPGRRAGSVVQFEEHDPAFTDLAGGDAKGLLEGQPDFAKGDLVHPHARHLERR